jgi:serine/threonine-protein kinase
MDPAERLKTTLSDKYRIERELGGGGMSRVFLATETALNRTVVIKIVAPGLLEGLSAERFTREVKVAARLQQANIVPLLSAGDADGLAYYTMPYVDGLSLRARLATGGPMGVAEAMQILRDVAKALAYAHGQGVIHRDIKPENVLLSGGTAIVTDFGIAKALNASRTSEGADGALNYTAETLTSAGSSLGTPGYMAPEQAVGSTVDFRADLYSWGIMAWELLSGAHPFAGRASAHQLVAAQIAERPVDLATKNPGVPRMLAAVVMQCLEKDPNARPSSAAALLTALDSVSTPDATRSDVAPARTIAPRRTRLLGAVAAVVVLVFVTVLALKLRPGAPARGASATADSSISSIAVLPFVNTSGDPRDEYFGDGMTDELAHALSKIQGLRLAGRSSSYSFKGKAVPAQQIGETLDVGAIIEGTVRRSGQTLRVTAQLTSTRDGRVLWSDSFENAGSDVFAVQDAFTAAIVGALTPRLAPSTGSITLASSSDTRGTRDAEAYELYLRGRYFWAQRGAGQLDSAVALFSRAVRRDPQFARGWAGLALAHVMRSNFNVLVPARLAFDSSEAAARRALGIDSTVADAWSALGMTRLRQFDFKTAERAMAEARRREPQNANAHHWSALMYGVMGDTIQAEREIETAVNLDPLSATTLNSRATIWSDRRRFREALEAYSRVAEVSESFATVYSNSSRALIWSGMADSALKAQQQRPASVRGRLGGQIFAAAAAGHWDEARRLREVIRKGEDPTVLFFDRAFAELVFGDRARAAELLVQSLETEGTIANVMFSLCDPPLDGVRDEPVFKQFRQRHGLADCPYRSPWPIKSPPPA